jgi:hypothetical protein
LETSTSPNSYQSYYDNRFNNISPNSFTSFDPTSSPSLNSNAASFYYETSSPNYFDISNYSTYNYAADGSSIGQYANYISPLVASPSNFSNVSYLSTTTDSAYSSTCNYQLDNSLVFPTPPPPVEYETPMTVVAKSTTTKCNTNEKLDNVKRSRVFKLANPKMYSPTFCTLCNVEFHSIAKCLVHTSRVHNRRKGNECPICCKKK